MVRGDPFKFEVTKLPNYFWHRCNFFVWNFQVTKLPSGHLSLDTLTLEEEKNSKGGPSYFEVTKLPNYIELRCIFFNWLEKIKKKKNMVRGDPFNFEVTKLPTYFWHRCIFFWCEIFKLPNYQVAICHWIRWLWKKTN